MNREIKFRVWHSDLKRMVYLDLYQTEHYGTDYVLRENNDETWIDDHCEPLTRTLMQYTGLKDNEGVDIYEGDIVDLTLCIERGDQEYFNTENVAVTWDQKHGAWYAGDHILAEYIDDEDWERTAKIVGNIYENPELMEKQS